MNIENVCEKIKCDGVFCKNLAAARIDAGSYKGYLFLCESCKQKLKNLLKEGVDYEK